MSRFMSSRYVDLEPYTPGEQPREQKYIKLNTNENPFPPPPEVQDAVALESEKLALYSDNECTELRKVLAKRLGVRPEELVITNGSDEILYFAFLAFCDEKTPAVFADITYGFYPVYAGITRVPARILPLNEDWTLDPTMYRDAGGTIFIANPNAPTGLALPPQQIEWILQKNPDHVVVVDEAYVDFGARSCARLIRAYENLLVIQTFSKSRSMAGGRLGYGIGNEKLIRDLNTIRYSINPYNVNSLTQAAGIACIEHDEYNFVNCSEIIENREWTRAELLKLGFRVTESRANFLFASHPAFPGDQLYARLKERGILIRHFGIERIRDWNRISIGYRWQMERMIETIKSMLEETV